MGTKCSHCCRHRRCTLWSICLEHCVLITLGVGLMWWKSRPSSGDTSAALANVFAAAAISISSPAAADTSISCLSHLVEQQNHDGSIEKRPASPSHRILVSIDGSKVMVLRTNGTPPVTLGIQEDSPKQMVANQITANGQILVVWFKPERAIRFALFISQVGRQNPAKPGVTPGIVTQYHGCEVLK